MKPFRSLLPLLLLVSGPVFAQGKPVTPEQLSFGPPPGWAQAGQTRQNNATYTLFTPPGQNAQNWQESVMLELRNGQMSDPILYLERMSDSVRSACPRAEVGTVQQGLSNGYKAGFRHVTCASSNAGFGEVQLYYTIQGKAGMYTVVRSWRTKAFPDGQVPVSKATIQDGVRYLETVRLCDPADPAHPCK
jgi:hypothetical protein